MVDFSSIPSVDSILQDPVVVHLIEVYSRNITVSAIRRMQSDLRNTLIDGKPLPNHNEIIDSISATIQNWIKPTLIPVINATGVLLHTNLGRSPLSLPTLDAIMQTSKGYSTLEFDLISGKRGSRLIHAEQQFRQLTGAEAAVVVNNNAGAVLLSLAALASRRKVIISRTQLVEIGGGFRIPDVMRQSGAKLLEIGTTNRTHLKDYENAMDEKPVMVLIAHHSNFRLQGFSTEPSLEEICSFAHAHNLPVLHDLGSGAMIDTEKFGLAHETTIFDSLNAGCDLICFSGDKLLGGPQAGIIIGKKAFLDKIRRHPFARALRADKMCLTALSATLAHYQKDEVEKHIPIYKMLSRKSDEIKMQALTWIEELGMGVLMPGKSTTGGGSLPEESLDSWLVALSFSKPDKFLSLLRKQNPPIIARIQNNQVVFDPRTVIDYQEYAFLNGVKAAINTMKA